MKIVLTFLVLIFITLSTSYAQTFDELIQTINNHSKIESIRSNQSAIEQEGKAKSQWSEPQLKLDTMNLPSDNPELGLSPMSSYGITLSQKIPLTSKYSNIEKSYNSLSKSEKYKLDILRRQIILNIWNHAISKEKITKSIEIYEDNLNWIEGMIKVSNRLYSTGKISQQAILDLKIRKSEIDSDIQTEEILLKKLDKNLVKFLDLPNQYLSLQLDSVPWNKLQNYTSKQDTKTPQELLLQSQLDASKFIQKANNQNRLPEINVGLNYKYRDDIDTHGDFIGGFVSIPIGNGSRKYQAKSSSYNYSKAKQDLLAYQNELTSFKEEIKLEIEKLESELNILTSQTIQFAKTSKEVVSKSYSVGKADYLELLRSELQLQNFLLKQIEIESKIKENKALYLFESGLDMY